MKANTITTVKNLVQFISQVFTASDSALEIRVLLSDSISLNTLQHRGNRLC